jgi:hypothetical protein
MTAHAIDLLFQVEAAGGSLLPNGAKLSVRAPKPLPDELVDQIRRAKPELLALLTWSSPTELVHRYS